jgi:long-subunit fatty acid transport protein
MDPDPFMPNTYVTGMSAGQVMHNRMVKRKGGMTEYNFNIAGNYGNKLFLGGTINAVNINYEESFTHSETSMAAATNGLNGFDYTGDLDIGGWGWNARLGAIVLPVDWIRIGAGFQTPTFLRLNDYWTNNMTTYTDSMTYNIGVGYVPSGSYKYNVRTPFRANASVGFVLKKFASIGAEVEYVNYAMANLSSRKFSAAPYPFTTENAQIENIYRPVFNYKVGVEGRVTPQFYVRGGFAYFPSPFKENKGNILYPTSFYTGGLGYNFGNLYLDFAFVMKPVTKDYYAYDPSLNGSHATVNMKNSQYLFTLGYRFGQD